MRSTTAVPALVGLAHGANIVLSNDNGFADYTIRKMYSTMMEANHSVVLCAPPYDQSDMEIFRKTGNEITPAAKFEGSYSCAFRACPQDAPPMGPDPKDERIWYYNAPAASAIDYGLNELADQFGFYYAQKPGIWADGDTNSINNKPIAVIGPDQGHLNTGRHGKKSGVIQAAVQAAKLTIPAIAISAHQGEVVPFDTNEPPAEAEVQIQIAKMIIESVAANAIPYRNPADPKTVILPTPIRPGSFLSVNIGGQKKSPCVLVDYKFAWTALQK